MAEELFMMLELHGRLPVFLPVKVCRWWEDGVHLWIEVQDEPQGSLGYAQWTRYQVPIENIKYWGPPRYRATRPIGYREAVRIQQ